MGVAGSERMWRWSAGLGEELIKGLQTLYPRTHILAKMPYGENLWFHFEHQKKLQQERHTFWSCKDMLNKYLIRQRTRNHPLGRTIGHGKFVEDFYDLEAVEKWCFSSCNNLAIRGLHTSDFSGQPGPQCTICNSCSRRLYEANTSSLPRLLNSKYEGTLVAEELHLGVPKEEIMLPNGNVLLEYDKVFRQMDYYEGITVLCQGKLRVIFTKFLKILSWEFCAQNVDVGVHTFKHSEWMTEAVGVEDAGFQEYVTKNRIDFRAHINNYGLPISYCRRYEALRKNKNKLCILV